MLWCQRDALVPSVQQRFNNRIPSESLSKKTQEAKLVTYAAQNCFTMTYCDVWKPLACLSGIVRAPLTQTRPMDMSMESIAAQNTRKTIVYLNYKYLKVFRCVGISCVNACCPQIIPVLEKDHYLLQAMCWMKCWFYRRNCCIRINWRQINRASCGQCRASSRNSFTRECGG